MIMDRPVRSCYIYPINKYTIEIKKNGLYQTGIMQQCVWGCGCIRSQRQRRRERRGSGTSAAEAGSEEGVGESSSSRS